MTAQQHFINRLRERYGMPCNYCVYEYLRAIAKRKIKYIKKKKGNRVEVPITPNFNKIRAMTRGDFTARSNIIYVIYDMKSDLLITALPTHDESTRYSKA